MKTQAVTEKSGTYWQDMIEMDEGALQDAFNRCAQKDITWAIDQARLVSLWSKPGSVNDKIARGFCLAAAGTLIDSSPRDAVEALQVAANHSDDPKMALESAKSLKATLEKIASNNNEAALGTALLLRARSQKGTAAFDAITEFMIDQDDAQTGLYLRGLIRGADDLKPDHKQKLIQHIINMTALAPYKAYVMADEMLGECTKLDDFEKATLFGLREELAERPDVIKEILRQNFGEDSEKAADEKKLMMMQPPTQTLH